MEKYNKNCNNNFTTKLNDKYNISFFSNNDETKILILKLNDKILWAKYKIICSYDINKNIIKPASEMIIIEKSILDNKLKINSKMNKIDEIENYIFENILNYYVGYIINKVNNIVFFIGIEKIIRF